MTATPQQFRFILACSAHVLETDGKETSMSQLERENMKPFCRCGHIKSIHLGIYGAQKRVKGRSCNFPECRCRDYTPVASKRR